jgi:hypothetical protein
MLSRYTWSVLDPNTRKESSSEGGFSGIFLPRTVLLFLFLESVGKFDPAVTSEIEAGNRERATICCIFMRPTFGVLCFQLAQSSRHVRITCTIAGKNRLHMVHLFCRKYPRRKSVSASLRSAFICLLCK